MGWLLYGAYGYTGRLIAREATSGHRRCPPPILAGRQRERVRDMARELGLDHRVFALDDPEKAERALEGVDLVLNAAGPYARTFRPLVEACLARGAHYLDVTGEIEILEAAHALDRRARDSGILVIPAVGLDVVPTDCLALRAVEHLPGTVALDLALRSSGGPSRGTARTMVERLAEPARVRRDGRIVDVPHGSITRPIPFHDGDRNGICIPWGDVSTAYHSTGVPHVRVFMAAPPSAARWLKTASTVLRLPGLPRIASWIVKRTVRGPSEEERREGRTFLWCEARTPDGSTLTLELTTPDGYTFTAQSAVAAVERVLEGRVAGERAEEPTGETSGAEPRTSEAAPRPAGADSRFPFPAGFRTPSLAFGSGFVDEIPGVGWIRRAAGGVEAGP